jgi:hypothetical protein
VEEGERPSTIPRAACTTRFGRESIWGVDADMTRC